MSKTYQFRYDTAVIKFVSGLHITEEEHMTQYLNLVSLNNGEPFSINTELFDTLDDAMERLNTFKHQYPTITRCGDQKCGFCEIVEFSDEDENYYESIARYATPIDIK